MVRRIIVAVSVAIGIDVAVEIVRRIVAVGVGAVGVEAAHKQNTPCLHYRSAQFGPFGPQHLLLSQKID